MFSDTCVEMSFGYFNANSQRLFHLATERFMFRSHGVGTETQSSSALTGCRASKGRYPSTSLDEKARTNSYLVIGVPIRHTARIHHTRENL
jgi:hypothetical protein